MVRTANPTALMSLMLGIQASLRSMFGYGGRDGQRPKTDEDKGDGEVPMALRAGQN